MNLTISIEDRLARQAQTVAKVRGLTLDRLVREYLESLITVGDVEQDLAELHKLSVPPRGDSQGWRFNREEIYRAS